MANLNTRLARRSSTVFLQVVVVLSGIAALALLLWEPHLEGRNAHATTFEVYFKDPLLAYVYIASIPFFLGLYYGFRVLGYVGQDQLFSHAAVRALRMIKICAIIVLAFIVVSFAFIFFGDSEDRPPGVFMRVLVGFPTLIVAAAAATLERIARNAVDMKSENDLTV